MITARQKVSVIKTVRLRYISKDYDGKECAWNTSYQTPAGAAKAWAINAATFWQIRTFTKKPMTQADVDRVVEREARYYKKALPIFKAMLK